MIMYKLTSSWPQHIESGAFVNPETNVEYLAWLAEGNTPEPYVAPPPPIPSTVSRFQALAALSAGGYLPLIRTYIATLGEDDITRLAFENATEWDRSSPTLAALAQMLSLSESDIDGLFVAASAIQA